MRNNKTIQSFIALVVMALFLTPLTAFAKTDPDIKIPASRYGPMADLKKTGRSKYLLPSLKDTKEKPLEPTKVRSYREEYYLLNPEAKPDKKGTIAFLQAERLAYGLHKIRKHKRHGRHRPYKRHGRHRRAMGKKKALPPVETKVSSPSRRLSAGALSPTVTPTPIVTPTPLPQASPQATIAVIVTTPWTIDRQQLLLGLVVLLIVALSALAFWGIKSPNSRPAIVLKIVRDQWTTWRKSRGSKVEKEIIREEQVEEAVEPELKPDLETRLNGLE